MPIPGVRSASAGFIALLVLGVTGCNAQSNPTRTPAVAATPSLTPSESPSVAATLTQWRLVRSPSPSVDNQLAGVACTASDNCWAVGTYNGDNSTGAKTLTEHWNGVA